LLWNQHVRAYESAVSHEFATKAHMLGVDEIEFSLRQAQIPVQQQLDEILQPPPPHVVRFWPYFAGYVALIALPFVVMYLTYRARRREFEYHAREIGAAMLFLSPWLLGMAVFIAGPILF